MATRRTWSKARGDRAFAGRVRVATLRDAPLRCAPQGEVGVQRERVISLMVDKFTSSQAISPCCPSAYASTEAHDPSAPAGHLPGLAKEENCCADGDHVARVAR